MKTIQVTLNAIQLDRLSDTLWRRKPDQFVSKDELEDLRSVIDKAIVDLDDNDA
jgi:DNA polymerase IIIc chi subunit